MSNILFIIQDPELPSSRVRVLNLLPELEKQGIKSTVLTYPKGSRDRLKVIREARNYDLVVLQKKLLPPVFITLLSWTSQRLVFDFDDAIYIRHDSKEKMVSSSRMSKFIRTVRRSDLVLAGNIILSEFAGQYNDRVVIIPSAVETRNIPVKQHRAENGRTVIGWVGGTGNLIHLNLVSPVLQRLATRYAIELRVLSSQTLDIPGVETRFVPWELETQAREIAEFDIGLMPLPDNMHTRGKCGYKALQYMAAGVPPVVSDVGINSSIIEHGKEGLVASSPEAFFQCLQSLIEDPLLRRELGMNARRRVEKEFSLHVVGQRLADILTEFVQRNSDIRRKDAMKSMVNTPGINT